MEINFLTFLNTYRNAPQFFFNSNFITLYGKNAFRNDLGPWEVPKLQNLHFHFYAFSGWGTSRGPKSFPKFMIQIFFEVFRKSNQTNLVMP